VGTFEERTLHRCDLHHKGRSAGRKYPPDLVPEGVHRIVVEAADVVEGGQAIDRAIADRQVLGQAVRIDGPRPGH